MGCLRCLLPLILILPCFALGQTIQFQVDSTVFYCSSRVLEKTIKKIGCPSCEKTKDKLKFLNEQVAIDDTVKLVSSEPGIYNHTEVFLEREIVRLLNRKKVSIYQPRIKKFERSKDTHGGGLTYSYIDKSTDQVFLTICLRRHKY